MRLYPKIIQSIKWNSASSMLLILLSIVQLYVLVRYIPQGDFGIMAICVLIVSYFTIIAQLGLITAVVQNDTVSPKQNATVFLVLIVSSILFYILMLFTASWASDFFDTPLLTELLSIVGLSIVFECAGGLSMAHLKRNIAFKNIQQANIIAAIANAILSITLAINDLGIYALIWGFTLSSLLKNILLLYHARKLIQLELSYDFYAIKELISFGIYDLANSFISNFTFRLDTLIIGKYLGTSTLGIYDIFKNILTKPQSLIIPVLTEVSLPVVSKIKKHKAKVREVYHTQMLLIYTIVAPIYIFLIMNHESVISFYLGDPWLTDVKIFVLLGLFYLIRISGVPIGTLLLGFGKSKRLFIWNIVLAAITTCLLLIFNSSLELIVIVLCLLQVLYVVPNYFINVQSFLNDSFAKYIRNILYPLIPAFFSYFIGYYISHIITGNLILNILSSLFIGSLIYFSLLTFIYKYLPTDMTKLLNKPTDISR